MSDPIALTLTDEDYDAAARTVYGEARGEPFEGQVAVAWVIRNRATWQPPVWWGHTVYQVCRKPYQFSCWNATDPNSKLLATLSPDNLALVAIMNGVLAVLSRYWYWVALACLVLGFGAGKVL